MNNINELIIELIDKRQSISSKISELEIELSKLNGTISTLKSLTCDRCGGSGDFCILDEAGSVSHEICDKCKGTGMYIGD